MFQKYLLEEGSNTQRAESDTEETSKLGAVLGSLFRWALDLGTQTSQCYGH